MTIDTYTLSVTAIDASGNVLPDARVVATLDKADLTADGVLLPSRIEAQADGDGLAELELASNLDGTQNSRYRIEIFRQTGKLSRIFDRVQMPRANTTLQQIIESPEQVVSLSGAAISAALAEAWAEGTEPGGEGTKSSREWALESSTPQLREDLASTDPGNGLDILGDNIGPGAGQAPRNSDLPFRLAEKTTYLVPADFPSVRDAVRALIGLRADSLTDKFLTVHIESGQTWGPRVTVPEGGVDASHIIITSDDAVVEVDDGHPAALIRATRGSKGPVLNCVVDMKGEGTNGYELDEGAFGYMRRSGGILNAGNDAIFANRQSDFLLEGSASDPQVPLTGAARNAIWADHNCRVLVRNIDGSNSGENGIISQAGSVVDCEVFKFDNCGTHALNAFNGRIVVARQLGEIDSPGSDAIVANRGGEVDIWDVNVTGLGDNSALRARNGGVIKLNELNVAGAGPQARVILSEGGDITVSAFEISGGARALEARDSGNIRVLISGKATGPAGDGEGVMATGGGRIRGEDIEINGYRHSVDCRSVAEVSISGLVAFGPSAEGVRARLAGRIRLHAPTITTTGGSNALRANGGFIEVTETAGLTTNIARNEISENGYIVAPD